MHRIEKLARYLRIDLRGRVLSMELIGDFDKKFGMSLDSRAMGNHRGFKERLHLLSLSEPDSAGKVKFTYASGPEGKSKNIHRKVILKFVKDDNYEFLGAQVGGTVEKPTGWIRFRPFLAPEA